MPTDPNLDVYGSVHLKVDTRETDLDRIKVVLQQAVGLSSVETAVSAREGVTTYSATSQRLLAPRSTGPSDPEWVVESVFELYVPVDRGLFFARTIAGRCVGLLGGQATATATWKHVKGKGERSRPVPALTLPSSWVPLTLHATALGGPPEETNARWYLHIGLVARPGDTETDLARFVTDLGPGAVVVSRSVAPHLGTSARFEAILRLAASSRPEAEADLEAWQQAITGATRLKRGEVTGPYSWGELEAAPGFWRTP